MPTPGKWIAPGNAYVYAHASGDTRVVCQVERDNDTAFADACLISAAPNLLAVCEALLDIAENTDGLTGWHLNGDVATWDELDIIPDLADAIAKAKGAAP